MFTFVVGGAGVRFEPPNGLSLGARLARLLSFSEQHQPSGVVAT